MSDIRRKRLRVLFFLTIILIGLSSLITSQAFADCSTSTPPTCSYVPNQAPNNKANITPSFSGPIPSCEQVTNNCAATVMVPTANQGEWSSFVTSQIANGGCVSLAGCGGSPGQCGADNGNTNLTAPPVNLCAAGSTLDNAKGGLQGGANGPWTWYCIQNDTDSPQCSASEASGNSCSQFYAYPAPPSPKVCSQQSVPFGTTCYMGTNKCFPTQGGIICETDCFKCSDNAPGNNLPPVGWNYTGCFGGEGCSGCTGGL